MDLIVEILKCKACGASIEAPIDARAFRCRHCGTLTHGASVPPKPRLTERATSSHGPGFRDLLVRIYCRVLIVMMLYILSTGPMYWILYEAFRANGSTFLAKLYLPIVAVCQHNDTICGWFDWYVGLWVY